MTSPGDTGRQGPHRHGWRACALAAVTLSSVLLTACASTKSAAPPAAAVTGSPATTPTTAQASGPSAAARMICDPEIRNDVEVILGLKTAPETTTTWADQIYTCTYHLPTGRLVLTVKESPNSDSADAYFSALRRQTPMASSLTGAKGLGNPGYESPAGVVVILKDGKTLKVDATGMPPVSGPNLIARADLAYEITTDILGCWTGD